MSHPPKHEGGCTHPDSVNQFRFQEKSTAEGEKKKHTETSEDGIPEMCLKGLDVMAPTDHIEAKTPKQAVTCDPADLTTTAELEM